MSSYRAAVDHGLGLGSLTVLSPQPRSEGVHVTRRDFMGDGSVVDQGLYVELVYDIIEDVTQYQTILTVFGLVAANSAEVTVYCRDALFNWVRYNGRAIRPEPSWNLFFPRNVVILVRDLVAL